MMNKISLGLSITSFVLILIMIIFGSINLNVNEDRVVVVEQPIYQSDLDRELSTIQSDLDRKLSTFSKLNYDNSEKIKLFDMQLMHNRIARIEKDYIAKYDYLIHNHINIAGLSVTGPPLEGR